MSTIQSIDFQTMRENCIEVHQITADIFRVKPEIHIYTQNRTPVLHADDLIYIISETKPWDGMGGFAAYLHSDQSVWSALPETATIVIRGVTKKWVKEEQRRNLIDAAKALGS